MVRKKINDGWCLYSQQGNLRLVPGRVAQLVGHLTRKSEVLGSLPGLATYFPFSADSRGAVVSYWRKNVHEVLVYRLGGLSMPRKTAVMLTDRPDITLDVYRGRKTTTQQQQQQQFSFFFSDYLCILVASLALV